MPGTHPAGRGYASTSFIIDEVYPGASEAPFVTGQLAPELEVALLIVIDETLGRFKGRSMVSTTEVEDLLLDIRLLVTRGV